MIKKVFPLIIVCAIVLTGCGEKKLNCSKTEEVNGIETTVNFSGKFSKNKIKSFTLEMNNNLENYSKSVSYYKEMIKKVYGLYDGIEGIKLSFEEEDSKIIIKFDVDVSKLSDDDKKKFNLFNFEKDYQDIRLGYLAEEYTCK